MSCSNGVCQNTDWGYVAAAAAAVAWGTQYVPFKTKRLQDTKVDPFVYQLYFSAAIFASGWLVLTFTHSFVFTPFGILSGFIWVMANVLRNFSIRKLGLGAGSGLSSGITMLVSFIWGNFDFARGGRPPIKSVFGSIIALELLFAGIFAVAIAYSDRIQQFIRAKEWPWLKRFERPPKSAQIETDLKETIIGFVVVIFAGIFNGSSLVPMKLAKEVNGIGFIISFCIGVVIATPIVVFLYFSVILREWPKFHFKKWIIPLYATGSGVMWNVGNLSSIYATWTLGFTIGFPITQLSLGVAAFWGLVLFKEIQGKLELLTYLLGVALLVAGAFMLGTFA